MDVLSLVGLILALVPSSVATSSRAGTSVPWPTARRR